jgi:Pvc16 N-terminal domain
MSNGLAISGVTAVLQYYLRNLYMTPGSPFTNPVNVSCLAPDLVQKSFGNDTEPENQVNLFLHQVTHNAAWRNVDLPSLGADGRSRLTSPPLALNLHYLLTVYATEFWQAEALLGYALMLLHENPVIVRADITNALQALSQAPEPYPGNPLTPFLKSSGLADQVEMIKITPETLGREEMAWLWTALKADYRPTYPFQVSVVLMQPQRQTNLASEVLHRRIHVQPIQPAQILEVQPPGGQLAAAATDTVTVSGEFLSGVTQVLLTNSRFGAFTVPVTSASATSFQFVPNQASSTLPAGVYELTAQFTDTSEAIVQTTNTLPFALAPTLPAQTATVVNSASSRQVNVTFSPNAVEGQTIALALSTTALPTTAHPFFSMSAPAKPFTGSTGSLSFVFPSNLPSGVLLGRLVVDGVTSQVQVNWHVHPPVFTGPMVTI